jgi:hypothetical protein
LTTARFFQKFQKNLIELIDPGSSWGSGSQAAQISLRGSPKLGFFDSSEILGKSWPTSDRAGWLQILDLQPA